MTSLKSPLSVDHRGKGVPYAAIDHGDSKNHGFKCLKGTPHLVQGIEEARDVPSMQRLLTALNEENSPFFSVGCEKSFNSAAEGHWVKGYVEFAFNYEVLVRDATNYFPLYFHFTRHAAEFLKDNNVQIWWELQAAEFSKAKCTGFTCAVWVTTGFFATPQNARAVWEAALELLTTFIAQAAPFKGKPIYESGG